jgi:hypothetical protein
MIAFLAVAFIKAASAALALAERAGLNLIPTKWRQIILHAEPYANGHSAYR